jgi:hypothetical protein
MEYKENIFVENCIKSFSQHFKCQREVWSKCRQGRIDIVLETDCGKFFGVEAKVPDRKRGEKIGEFVKQAIRYSAYEFEVRPNHFEVIPIFICPPISYKYFLMNEQEQIIDGVKWHRDRHNEVCEHHSFNGFLGSFNIGEIRNIGNGFFALINSNKIIYSTGVKRIFENGRFIRNEKFGLHEENYKFLIKKIATT